MLIRRARLIALATAIAVAAGLFIHNASQPSAVPGRFLTWSTASTPAPSGAPLASLLPSPTAQSHDPLDGLRLPLRSVLQGLNADTAASSRGEYDILRQLSDALRDRIDSFLHWVTAQR